MTTATEVNRLVTDLVDIMRKSENKWGKPTTTIGIELNKLLAVKGLTCKSKTGWMSTARAVRLIEDSVKLRAVKEFQSFTITPVEIRKGEQILYSGYSR